MHTQRYIFSPRVILYNFFLILLIYGGLGFWGWGLILGFWGWGFQLMGFGACGVGLSWFYRDGALYTHRRITLGKNGALEPVPRNLRNRGQSTETGLK